MRRSGIPGILQREVHLDVLAYAMILVLLGLCGVLLFMLLSGTPVPEFWLFGDHVFRTVFIGLLLGVILYMVDQHRRLRARLLDAHSTIETANRELTAAYEQLSFAQRAAEVMTSLSEADALGCVLKESIEHFGANAAAVVSEDVTLIADEATDTRLAQKAVLQVALDAVRAGKPIEISNTHNGSEALAVPLRVRGDLTSVLCLWKRGEPFAPDHLEGLGLVARIIELSTENQTLLGEARTQLNGTMRMLAALIDNRVPDYRRRSAHIAEHAVAVGESLGLSRRELSDLRISAMLADVGMLEVPDRIIGARRKLTAEELGQIKLHPEKGAAVARNAAFSAQVQDTIRDHHERLDGSGYPRQLKGEQIGLPARILAVVDVYNSMTTARPHRPAMSVDHAVSELVRGADTLFDRRVIRAFLQVTGYRPAERTTEFTADVASESFERAVLESIEVN